MAEDLFAGGVEENLSMDQLNALFLSLGAVLPNINKFHAQLSFVFLGKFGQHRHHHFAGDAFVGA